MDLNVEFKFCAAHRLPNYDGPCNRVHGHNYRFEVEIRGEPDPHSGMILDFVDIDLNTGRVRFRVLQVSPDGDGTGS